MPVYRAGLEALEAEALARTQTSFAALPAEAQDQLLRQVEAGQVLHRWPVGPAQFFADVVQHESEGYYADPGNCHNRNQAARPRFWCMASICCRSRRRRFLRFSA